MNVREPPELFALWSTPLIADACACAAVPLRLAPRGVRPLLRWMRLAGAVRPVRHGGGIDLLLELAAAGASGDVALIDDDGQSDES